MKRKLMALAVASALGMADAATTTETPKKEAKPKIKVAMQDGREVEFPQETKAKKAFVYAAKDGGTLTDDKEKAANPAAPVGVRWDFVNGHTRTILLTELTNLTAVLGCHGLSQKGGDEYASEKDVDDAVLAFDDLMDRLKKGEWSEKREGGFGGASVLAKAICEAFGKTMEETRAFLRELSPQEKAGLRASPELKAIVDRLEAEKAKSGKVDVNALLAKAKSLGGAPAAA